MLTVNAFVVIILFAIVRDSSTVTNRSRENADTCGISINETGSIDQGQNFARGSFPWIVALMHAGYTTPKLFCGGTLISKTFVITGK